MELWLWGAFGLARYHLRRNAEDCRAAPGSNRTCTLPVRRERNLRSAPALIRRGRTWRGTPRFEALPPKVCPTGRSRNKDHISGVLIVFAVACERFFGQAPPLPPLDP